MVQVCLPFMGSDDPSLIWSDLITGPQLRHLEFLVKKTLRQIILVKQLPRSLLQLCLQITSMPRQGEVAARPPGTGTLAALLLASSMAMLAASIPMSTILAVATIEGEGQRTSTRAPSHGRLIAFSHTFAFSNQQELIFTNAEGEFAIGTLIDSEKQARSVCFATLAVQGDASPDADMTDVPSTGMLGLIEETLRRQLPVS